MTKKTETTSFALFERMRDMDRSRLERLREIQQIELDFGTRLRRCRASGRGSRTHPGKSVGSSKSGSIPNTRADTQ